MEITLSPELEAVVAADVATGRYGSVQEYVAVAIELLHERVAWREETLEELNASLETAWQEAERGDLMTPEDFRQEMQEMKKEWLASRPSA